MKMFDLIKTYFYYYYYGFAFNTARSFVVVPSAA